MHWDYLKAKIQKLEKKVGTTLGEALDDRVIKECLALFNPMTSYDQTVQDIMKDCKAMSKFYNIW